MKGDYKRALLYVCAHQNNLKVRRLWGVHMVHLIAYIWDKSVKQVADDIVQFEFEAKWGATPIAKASVKPLYGRRKGS